MLSLDAFLFDFRQVLQMSDVNALAPRELGELCLAHELQTCSVNSFDMLLTYQVSEVHEAYCWFCNKINHLIGPNVLCSCFLKSVPLEN